MQHVYSQRKRYVKEEIVRKSEQKRISGEAYDKNKQRIYIALK